MSYPLSIIPVSLQYSGKQRWTFCSFLVFCIMNYNLNPLPPWHHPVGYLDKLITFSLHNGKQSRFTGSKAAPKHDAPSTMRSTPQTHSNSYCVGPVLIYWKFRETLCRYRGKRWCGPSHDALITFCSLSHTTVMCVIKVNLYCLFRSSVVSFVFSGQWEGWYLGWHAVTLNTCCWIMVFPLSII